MKRLLASAILPACTAAALAQTPCPLPDNCVTNPSFELVDPFSAAQDPEGWHGLSNPNESKRRVIGDSFQPPAVARTGNASISLSTPGQSQFRGMTTDWRNFNIPGVPFYDPFFDWDGGDVVVRGWYYIPTTHPIVGDFSFIKLNVKRGNQDYATFDAASRGPDTLRIQGHTNNEWRMYELRWPISEIRDEVFFNESEGYFVLPPYPDHLKITIGRFGFDNVPSSGVIFWDDISFVQEAGSSCPVCAADFNEDGGVDGSDVEAFFVEWVMGEACADVNEDGGVDGSDVEAFFLLWEAGGC